MAPVDMPLIDSHTHIGHLPGVLGEVFYPEDLLYIAEHEGVRFMLVSSATATTVAQHVATDEAVAMVGRYGDRLGGMLWINPHDPTWQDDVERAVEAGFYGIKIHPSLDRYAVTPQALDQVFSCAQERHWPILTHADQDGSPMSAGRYEPLIRAYPDVALILAHLRLEAIPLAKRFDNVWVDTTYVDPVRVELGVDALGPGKILFGSDACEGFDVGHATARERPPRSYAAILAAYRERGIRDAALEQICYINAKALFGLKHV
jgi:predicted TIM-barrel fold metal-dependent hydrolase